MCRILKFSSGEQGTSLLEMMIAMLVLAVGLLGSMAVVSVAIGSNSRSRRDSTSAALAELVAGQISAIPLGGGVTAVTATDCAGNAVTINTSGTAAGSGANLNTYNNIDFTQTFSSVPAGYGMRYTVCGVSNGTQTVYDVRWNIKTLASGKEEFVVVGAQAVNSNSTNNALQFSPAVNVRTIVGNDGN